MFLCSQAYARSGLEMPLTPMLRTATVIYGGGKQPNHERRGEDLGLGNTSAMGEARQGRKPPISYRSNHRPRCQSRQSNRLPQSPNYAGPDSMPR